MKEASEITVKQIENYLNTTKNFDWNELKNGVREVLSRYLFDQTRRRPMVMPVVMEVNQNRRPTSHKSNNANNKTKTRQAQNVKLNKEKNNTPKKKAKKVVVKAEK